MQQNSQQNSNKLDKESIQLYLLENDLLIQTIYELLSRGRPYDATVFQYRLQQNLIYLAAQADSLPEALEAVVASMSGGTAAEGSPEVDGQAAAPMSDDDDDEKEGT